MKAVLFLLLFAPIAKAEKIVPTFQQGTLNQHVETRSVVLEDIKSYDIRNGYQLTIGGENTKPSTTNIAPTGFTRQSGNVGGVATIYTLPDLTNKPEYSIVNEGAPWAYYETLETPGIQNFTHIIRETTIEQVSDSTSVFQ
jgi:hypothetical protein